VSDAGVIERLVGARLYVERVTRTTTEGGLHLPQTFSPSKRFGQRERMNAVPDYFLAKVLAVGPDEKSGLQPGDLTYVWSHAGAGGDKQRLWVGETVGDKDRLFINGEDGSYDPEKCDHLHVVVEP
jgi:hypothetical protein